MLQTDAKLMGGFDQQTFRPTQDQPLILELKKQYDVSSVSADTPISGDLDVLLVAQPASLTQKQLDNLTTHVQAGKPTLFFVDPMPMVDPQIAPEMPRPQPGGQFGGGPPPEPKGDLTSLFDIIGVDWPASDIVWNPYLPHPNIGDPEPEIVFIGKGGAGGDAFNANEVATSGLQEVVMIYGGQLRMKGGGPDFVPLLKTSKAGGTVAFSELMTPSMTGRMSMNPNVRHRATL